uniref:OX-2 membrane glycoprotein-like n=1 Tax=Semicossyphus pulcher TaxID=241346 RepID=UPI0037E9C709
MLLLIFIGLLFKASMSHITISGNKTAVYGRDAHYGCIVDNPKGVLQVTWQRLPKDQSIENLATYSHRFGEQVNEPYHGKVIFTEVSLNSSSITVRNVTWEDDSCYICSFNAFPEGSQRKQICLTVQGISEVKTEVHSPSSEQEEDEDVVGISCSATGKPAPTIHWDFPPEATILNQSQSATVINSDRTFTSSSSITLQVPSDWNGYVDCVLNKGVRGQRRERIPFSFGPGDETNKEEKVKSLSKSGIALVISSTVFVTFIAVAVALKRKRLMSNRRNANVV